MKVCFSLLVVIIVHFYGTDACACVRPNRQAQYCNSAFVVIGKVTGESIEKRTFVYDVEVTKVYKGNVSKGTIKIKTPESDGVCGVILNVNNVYLLNGYLWQNEMWISLCEMIRLYSIDDTERVLPLDTYYDCRCTVLDRYLNPKGTESKYTCLSETRLICPDDSGPLETLAECHFNEAGDNCTWQCKVPQNFI